MATSNGYVRLFCDIRYADRHYRFLQGGGGGGGGVLFNLVPRAFRAFKMVERV